MCSHKNKSPTTLSPIRKRYIMIDENILSNLDLYTLSLYMIFRFEADYSQEDSEITRTAEYLYSKAKIKRSQYYKSLNELEKNGLILRDENNKLGKKCIFHVAQELGYFTGTLTNATNDLSEINKGVHDMDRGVHDMDTDHYLIPLSTNINISTISEVVETFHSELPELPQVKKLDTKLQSQIKKMIKDWPSYQKDGKKFSIESFKDYLNLIKMHYPWFLKPYKTESGTETKCTLRKITREINISKFVNGEFSAN